MARKSYSYCKQYALTAIWHDKAIATDHDDAVHITTRCYGCPSNAALGPRNDTLLRTTLAMQHLVHIYIYNSTIQADDITHLAEDHIQQPRTVTYTFVFPANKIVTLLYLLSHLLSSFIVSTHLHTKSICGIDALIDSAT